MTTIISKVKFRVSTTVSMTPDELEMYVKTNNISIADHTVMKVTTHRKKEGEPYSYTIHLKSI